MGQERVHIVRMSGFASSDIRSKKQETREAEYRETRANGEERRQNIFIVRLS